MQEIEPRCGEALCRLFPPDENIDLKAIAIKARRARHSAAAAATDDRRRFPGPSRFERQPRLGLLLFGLISYGCHGLRAS